MYDIKLNNFIIGDSVQHGEFERQIPFLNDELIQWVEDINAKMSLHERVRQLLHDPIVGMNKQELLDFFAKYPIAPGGIV